MKTLTKMAKINFFKTLEISQKLPTIWGVFIQEKLLNLIKQGLWHCNLNCSHLPLFRSAVTLKTSSLANMVLVNPAALQPLDGAVLVWSPSKSPVPRTLSLFDLSCSSLEKPHLQGIVITRPWWELRTCSAGKAVSPAPLLKTICGPCLTYHLMRGQYQLGK